MANLNKVFLIGRLARDPELRYIPSGTAVATFTVATNRSYTMASGEKREETCFVRIVAWGRQAELCGEYLTKGSPVFVDGRLQSRSWETQDGQKRSTLEVVAQNIQFLGKVPKQAAEVAELEPTLGDIPESPIGGTRQKADQEISSGDISTAADIPEQGVPESPAGEDPF